MSIAFSNHAQNICYKKIFGAITNDANGAANSISFLGKNIKDVIKDYNAIDSDKLGVNKISNALSGMKLFGYSQSDIQSIKYYNSLIEQGANKSAAFAVAMNDASTSAKNLVRDSKTATVAIDTLSASERVATAVTQAFSVALNMGLTLVASMVVSKAVSEINEIANAEEKVREASQDARNAAVSAMESYDAEANEVENLISEYIKLYTTTSDLSTEKERLIEIQDKLNKGIADQTQKVDLLNGSLEENLRLLREQSYEDAQVQLNRIEPEYIKASGRQSGYNTSFKNLTSSDLGEKVAKGIEQEFLDYFESVADALEVESRNPVTGEVKKEYKSILDRRTGILGLNASGMGNAYDDYLKELDLIIQYYKDWDGKSNTVYQDLVNLRDEVSNLGTVDKQLINQHQALEQTMSDYQLVNPETEQQLDTVLSKVVDLSKELNQTKGAAARSTLTRQITELREEAYALADENIILKHSADAVFSAYVSGTNASLESATNLRATWFSTIDDFEKGEMKIIDAMTKGMQTIAGGEKISYDDFLKIFEIDTDGILSDINMVNGEVSVSLESLQQLKDSYINKQIEAYQEDIESIREEHKNELAEYEQYKDALQQIQDEITEKNIDTTKTVFGNVNTDTREILEWTEENLSAYADVIDSWGLSAENLRGTISTVLGSVDEFDGVDIAFTPILETPEGSVMLDKDTVYTYINSILSRLGDNWTKEDLFKLDAEGMEVDGKRIMNILADVGATAQNTSEIMHYLGKNGALALTKEAFEASSVAVKDFNDAIYNDSIMLEYLNSLLGNTIDMQKALKSLSDQASKKADGLLKAQQYKIDQIIQGYTDEKTAIEDARDELKRQLETLEEQEKVLKEIQEDYETAADIVSEAIQEQIDKLKEENEEREDALDLAEKLANLENAKNNKVRSYTEAGGWTYEAKKADVVQAEKELQKSQNEERIKQLEAYQKKWSKLTNKAEKAADERTATEILGADWREKIAVQDEDIFDMYDEEYQKYCEQLYQVSDVEMKTLKDEIEAKDKEVKAKEEQIKSWQRYKTGVTNAANQVKSATEDWYKYLSGVTLSESSTLEEREKNLRNFKEEYGRLVGEIADYSKQIQNLNSTISFDTSGISAAANQMSDLMDGVMLMGKALAESPYNFGIINSAGDEALYREWKEKVEEAQRVLGIVGSGASGAVVDRTGLLAVHGTKQKAETIFNANDSAKLYDLVHNTPNLIASMLTDGTKIAQGMQKNVDNSGNISFNNTTINLPNVQNPEQFAQQMEMYMQTVLGESQVYKPRR